MINFLFKVYVGWKLLNISNQTEKLYDQNHEMLYSLMKIEHRTDDKN